MGGQRCRCKSLALQYADGVDRRHRWTREQIHGNSAAVQRRRYCAQCGRWALTISPRGDGTAVVILRPGTTEVRGDAGGGYLCDSCALELAGCSCAG
jgi:hypothetical protein